MQETRTWSRPSRALRGARGLAAGRSGHQARHLSRAAESSAQESPPGREAVFSGAAFLCRAVSPEARAWHLPVREALQGLEGQKSAFSGCRSVWASCPDPV